MSRRSNTVWAKQVSSKAKMLRSNTAGRRGDYSRLPALADELVGRQVSVIATYGGARSALAAKAATSCIPIVFMFGDGDPITYGLVRSFNQPGGNVTGLTMVAGLMEPKRLEILHELLPGLRLLPPGQSQQCGGRSGLA